MGLERYFGFHFTETCIYIAEAYEGREGGLHWETIEQANYELDSEWLPLFKDAIPNLYDNENQVYGFDALPSIWSSFSYNRFLRFNLQFLEKAVEGKITSKEQGKLAKLFRYCQVYHIRPQSDEDLIATVAVEQLTSRQRAVFRALLEQVAPEAAIAFVDVIDPEEAGLRYLWYEDSRQHLGVEQRMVLLVNLGYARTLLTPWYRCQEVSQSALAPGMLEIDRGIAMYAGSQGMNRTIGMEELLLYAQRARRAFTSNQPTVRVVERKIERSTYVDIIQERVTDIVTQLERFVRSLAKRAHPVDEILLIGEGADFPPVRKALQTACTDIPTRFLPQAIYSVARGAASKSWRSQNPDAEVR
jgi:hypothetical protein